MRNVYYFEVAHSPSAPDSIIIEMSHDEFVQLIKTCIDDLDTSYKRESDRRNIQFTGFIQKFEQSQGDINMNNNEIPEREKWLYENKEAFESLNRGIEQAERGEVREIDWRKGVTDEELKNVDLNDE